MRRVLPPLLLAGLLVTVASAPAEAATRYMWATINVCDTAASPNSMGVRASMPGNGTSQRMYMRFHATWFSRSRQVWFHVEGDGTSPWIYAGSARHRAHQAGYSFQFGQPTPGSTFVVRGVVEMQWRARVPRRRGRAARWQVVERKRATTRGGIPNVGAGDPPGRSDGLCVIS
jgi:hypothetical protein